MRFTRYAPSRTPRTPRTTLAIKRAVGGNHTLKEVLLHEGPFIRDFVFPIAQVAAGKTTDTVDYNELAGTAFLIGNRGAFLTARHVLDRADTGMMAMFASESGWEGVPVRTVTPHASEDVSVGVLATKRAESPFVLSTDHIQAWSDFFFVWISMRCAVRDSSRRRIRPRS